MNFVKVEENKAAFVLLSFSCTL